MSEARNDGVERRMLPVGDGHELYVEVSGPADAPAAVYLHGGPGSGCQPDHRKLFDARCRVVLFDQRGAGRSRPRGERAANTTAHLVADLETIRAAFGIPRWLVVGGSWGATLALAYAQQHPEVVNGLVLRATFLGTRAELDQAFGAALPRVHPGLHQDFLALLPPDERATPLEAYWRRILDPDPAVHAPAARAWFITERAMSELKPSQTRFDPAALASSTASLPATPFMESHYFSHDCFMAPDQLMAGAGRLAGIPGIIVQGRYDLLCPPATAQALQQRWPGAELRIVEGAGHSLGDPGVGAAVSAAIADLMRAQFSAAG
jgi:proline iminopeptidase